MHFSIHQKQHRKKNKIAFMTLEFVSSPFFKRQQAVEFSQKYQVNCCLYRHQRWCSSSVEIGNVADHMPSRTNIRRSIPGCHGRRKRRGRLIDQQDVRASEQRSWPDEGMAQCKGRGADREREKCRDDMMQRLARQRGRQRGRKWRDRPQRESHRGSQTRCIEADGERGGESNNTGDKWRDRQQQPRSTHEVCPG